VYLGLAFLLVKCCRRALYMAYTHFCCNCN